MKSSFLFKKINFIILIISLVVIVIGFVLMIGGGGSTPTEFNPEIFSSQRIKIAPLVILIGYMGIGCSIFYNDRRN